MNRDTLLSKLSEVNPAISDSDLIPILSHYWITGEAVMAFNDAIAISVPFECPVKGAVPQWLLYPLLNKSTGSTVDMKKIGDVLEVKVGGKNEEGLKQSTKFKVPVLSEDNFLFTMPDEKGKKSQLSVDSDEFLNGVEVCLQSLGHHVTTPERRGVVLMPKSGNRLHMYSTDEKSMSFAEVKLNRNAPFEEPVILYEQFCSELLRQSKSKGFGVLEIVDNYSLHVSKDGVKLFGRLLHDSNPPPYEEIMSHYLPKDATKKMVEIPEEIQLLLDRAYISIQKTLSHKCVVKVVETKKGDKRLTMITTSEHNSITDSIKFPDHPDCNVRIDLPSVWNWKKSSFNVFDRILFDEKCVVMGRGAHMLHMISTFQSEDDSEDE